MSSIEIEEAKLPTITRAFGDDARACCLEVLSDIEWWTAEEIQQETGNQMAVILAALDKLEDMSIVEGDETVRGPSWRLDIETHYGSAIAMMAQEER